MVSDIVRTINELYARGGFTTETDNFALDKGGQIVGRALLDQLQSLSSNAPPGFTPDLPSDIFLFGQEEEFNERDMDIREMIQRFFGDRTI